jgi:hypothetical protein
MWGVVNIQNKIYHHMCIQLLHLNKIAFCFQNLHLTLVTLFPSSM